MSYERGRIAYGDLVAALMVCGLVTSTKVKLHLPTSITRSGVHLDMTCLIYVHKVACGCEVPTNLYCGYSITKKKFGDVLSYM